MDKRSEQRHSWRPFSRFTIAAPIMAIVLTLAVPLNLVVAAAVWHVSETASRAQRMGLLYTAHSIAAAVEAKLGEYIALTQALARSPALLDDNLDAFEAEARLIFASKPEAWAVAANPEGQQLINTSRRPGQIYPILNPVAFHAQKHAIEIRSAVFTDIQHGTVTQDWIICVEVPIFKNGRPFRALVTAIKAQSFLRLLNNQQLPQEWLAGIIDLQGRYVARAPGGERYAGQLASEGWRHVKDQDGISEFASLEGEPLINANVRSPISGWAVAVAAKKSILQQEALSTIRWTAMLGGGLSILSLMFASAVARRMASAIEELQPKTGALPAPPDPSKPQGPARIRELWQASMQSAASYDRSGGALHESEARFRGVFERAGTCIAITDLNGQFRYCNPAYCKMLGYSEQELRQLTFAKLLHPEDLEANMALTRRLIAQEMPSFDIVNRYVAKDGKSLWVAKNVFLLRDTAGKPCNMATHVTDITERKRHEDQVRLLMSEVHHRSKNMLTLVQAIARQTLAAKHGDFLERFGARVQALAASQDLLVKNAWTGVDLEDLVRSQLAHFEDLIGRQIELRGPQLFVSAHAAQTIGMALHELATNAGKYGALASEDGRVEISWGVQHGKTGEAFIITWRERCAHPIAAPSKHGFGSTVISEMTVRSLGATVDLDFPLTGLTWRLKCAAGEVLDGTGPAASGGDDGPADSAA